MGNIPTLQEVREYFKNAETIKSIQSNREDNITEKFELVSKTWYIKGSEYGAEVWNENKGYAKILTYKQPTYTITKEQILELEKTMHKERVDYLLKQWFPDVFEVNLEVGKWYKRIWKDGDVDLFLISDFKIDKFFIGEFFRNNERLEEAIGYRFVSKKDERYYEIEATEQEVFEALKNEAVKRGFKEDVYILSPKNKYKYKTIENIFYYDLEDNILSIGGYNIFNNGIWAEIITTLTKKEAEEKLNCKII